MSKPTRSDERCVRRGGQGQLAADQADLGRGRADPPRHSKRLAQPSQDQPLMRKTPNRRLKVFQTQLGFYDSVVAAPSQAAALRAWGTRQNLFAEGAARLAADNAAVAAALDHPGTPLRRAVGSKAPFSLEPDLPDAPTTPRRNGAAPAKTAKAPAGSSKRPPDRRALDAAEARLGAINDRRVAEEADFDRRREALEAENERARQAWAMARAEAERAVERARAAYRERGG
ncbi:hypothetical protein [Phenylobacterium sp.]|jgi:hypothetical protein|uniref:hypothetical protein n=1 Tax=Phenylobacterium sp. TaxID=1871053 RepID=UPI002E368A77|nr:hypothetical protein [Phenylobacterium sp.]HEX3367639.1 hypothetical protein [Phenylobacterium sp.]